MARPTTAARRYAEAAFELARRDDALDAWRDDLHLAAELTSDEQVARIVDNPAAPIAQREDVIERLLAGRVSRPVHNLVVLLVRRGRISALPAVAREFVSLLNRERGIVAATVTSASPLTAGEVEAIRARLVAMTNAQVDLETAVDPGIIGGVTVRVGDRLLDASVRGRLGRLRAQLVAGSRQAHGAGAR